MTKVALLADTHFGVRSESPAFFKNQAKFFDEVFWPAIDEHKIDFIFHLGDLVDRRKYVSFVTLRHMREHFFKPMYERNIELYVIAGNHDCYYRNTNALNAPNELIHWGKVLWEPDEMVFDEAGCLFLPWISPENMQASLRIIKESKARYCFAHLELAGFEMHKGHIMEGFDPALFTHFDAVYTGHYHHRSSKGNIHYVGAPYEMTWADYDDPRGFDILDLVTGERTYIQNPHTIHEKVIYEVGKPMPGKMEGKIVKLVVKGDASATKINQALMSLGAAANVQVMSAQFNVDDLSLDGIEIDVGDAMGLIKEAVAQVDLPPPRRDELNVVMKELYDEALTTVR